MFQTLKAVPIEPHIPEDPTEAEVLALLEQMGYGLAYYNLGIEVPLSLHMPPGGEAHQLDAVMGVYWLASHDPDVCTVYIDNKPYQFAASWVQDQASKSGHTR